jgi:ATP-dependent Clp endopeptidase proteolytic subunit ClpP
MSLKRKIPDIMYSAKKAKKSKDAEPDLDEDALKAIGEALGGALGGSRKQQSDVKIALDNNHIYFHSEVDRDSIFDLCGLITEAEEENVFMAYKMNIDPIPIYLHINSYGGSIFAAFAAIDCINSCKVPVYTIIEGAVASAGTLISVFGKKRFIRPYAYMLIHQLSSSFWGKMSEIDDEHKNLTELTQRILKIYRENTTLPKKELQELLKHDLWLNVEKALKYGLVDEIYN